MLKMLKTRLKQGQCTTSFPKEPPVLSDRFRGRPVMDISKCPEGCKDCQEACPTDAIILDKKNTGIDLGRCLFCTDCVNACPEQAITYTQEYRLAGRKREDLFVQDEKIKLAQALDRKTRQLFGRSLKLRQVSAGGCNGCESEVNVLNTILYDIGRFGIQFVASPRHADGLLITGPVTKNMSLALKKTYEAIPNPKLVIAMGACAISGGPYINHVEAENGAEGVVPVDLYIPGCPPHPVTILDGILRLIGRLPLKGQAET